MNLEFCICIHIYTYVGWWFLSGIFSASEDLNPVPDKQVSSRRGGVLWADSSMDVIFPSVSAYLSGLPFNRLNLHKSQCRNKEGTIFLFGSSVTQNTFPGENVNFNSFVWIPAEHFSSYRASIKHSPFLLWSKGGGIRGSWLAAQKGCTARGSRAGPGWERFSTSRQKTPGKWL